MLQRTDDALAFDRGTVLSLGEYKRLRGQVVSAACQPRTRILFWGVSDVTLRLISELCRLGLAGAILGLTDHRPGRAGMRVAEWVVLEPTGVSCLNPDYLVVGLDDEKEDVLREFARLSRSAPAVILFGMGHYKFRDSTFDALVAESLVKSHAGGYPHMLMHLYQSLRSVASRGLKGDVAEFGVYKGGTTTFLARCLQALGHAGTVFGFDTFAGFPQRRSVLDAHTDPEDEYRNEAVVRAHCALYPNLRLVSGDIMKTHRVLEGRHLVLTFFDTDNYSATRAALPLCAEITAPGGVIAFDHYYSPSWPTTIGERLAAQEVLMNPSWFNLHGTGIFLKVG